VADASAWLDAFPTAFADRYLIKAQFALAMFSGCARRAGISHDAANLTAFADDQAPRILRTLGVLRYAQEVADAVDAWQLLASESAVERAIRAATILACEEIAAHTGRTAVDVDGLLRLSQDVDSTTPFHLTETPRTERNLAQGVRADVVGGNELPPQRPSSACKFEVTRRSAPRHAEGAQLV